MPAEAQSAATRGWAAQPGCYDFVSDSGVSRGTTRTWKILRSLRSSGVRSCTPAAHRMSNPSDSRQDSNVAEVELDDSAVTEAGGLNTQRLKYDVLPANRSERDCIPDARSEIPCLGVRVQVRTSFGGVGGGRRRACCHRRSKSGYEQASQEYRSKRAPQHNVMTAMSRRGSHLSAQRYRVQRRGAAPSAATWGSAACLGRGLQGTAVLFSGADHPLRRVGDGVDADFEGLQLVPHV
jgi:hypothetical protein